MEPPATPFPAGVSRERSVPYARESPPTGKQPRPAGWPDLRHPALKPTRRVRGSARFWQVVSAPPRPLSSRHLEEQPSVLVLSLCSLRAVSPHSRATLVRASVMTVYRAAFNRRGSRAVRTGPDPTSTGIAERSAASATPREAVTRQHLGMDAADGRCEIASTVSVLPGSGQEPIGDPPGRCVQAPGRASPPVPPAAAPVADRARCAAVPPDASTSWS